MDMEELKGLLKGIGVPVYLGYADSCSAAPYLIIRPIYMEEMEGSLCGGGLVWDSDLGVYCCSDSVATSHGLALDVMRSLEGKRLSGNPVSTTMGYSGAKTEGLYESQVTVSSVQVLAA